MLGAIVIGLVAGWLTGKLMRGRGYGVLMDILLGLIGSVIGASIFHAVGFHGPNGAIGAIATATVGAVVLVALTRVVRGEL